MEKLDYVVNEILRARDTIIPKGTYAGSPLEVEHEHHARFNGFPGDLDTAEFEDCSRAWQWAASGSTGSDHARTAVEKIKHRRHKSANFRIQASSHIFVINVDKPNNTPDSITEFDVVDFCGHCRSAAQHL